MPHGSSLGSPVDILHHDEHSKKSERFDCEGPVMVEASKDSKEETPWAKQCETMPCLNNPYFFLSHMPAVDHQAATAGHPKDLASAQMPRRERSKATVVHRAFGLP